MRRMLTGLAMVAVATMLAACGFPTQDSPSPLAEDEQLDRPTELSTARVPTEDVTVWFVRDGLLAARGREVPVPADAHAVVQALAAGVTTTEADGRLRSAIPDAAMVGETTLERGTAVVQLSGEFLDIPVGDQVLALGQVVYTLTDLRGVGRVRFEIDGEAVSIPLPDGTSTDTSVSRDEFAVLVG